MSEAIFVRGAAQLLLLLLLILLLFLLLLNHARDPVQIFIHPGVDPRRQIAAGRRPEGDDAADSPAARLHPEQRAAAVAGAGVRLLVAGAEHGGGYADADRLTEQEVVILGLAVFGAVLIHIGKPTGYQSINQNQSISQSNQISTRDVVPLLNDVCLHSRWLSYPSGESW